MMSFDHFVAQLPYPPDAQQMAAIMCDDNCVVSAGAGSGKTDRKSVV